jgi:hypothetical protein
MRLANHEPRLRLMEPQGLLPCLQEPAIGPYPEPDESNPYSFTINKAEELGRCSNYAAGWTTEDSEVRFSAGGKRSSPFAQRPGSLLAPPSLLSHLYPVFFVAVMRPGRDAQHSHPSSAVFKKALLPQDVNAPPPLHTHTYRNPLYFLALS